MRNYKKISTILMVFTVLFCILVVIGTVSAADTENNAGPTVTANLTGGTYNTTQTVALAANDSSAAIYYANDATDPRNSSTRITYTKPIVINTSTTLRYAAVDSNGNWGPLYLQNYVIGNGKVTNSTGQSNYTGPQTNTTKWNYTTGSAINSPAIGLDGTIYIVTYYPGYTGAYFYALNPDGTLKWTYTTNNSVTSSPSIGSDGTIYIGCADGKLYALNPNGTLKWTYTVEETVNSLTVGSDGTIYFGAGELLCALTDDGTQANMKWNYATTDIPSSITIGSDGTVYFGAGFHLNALNTDGTLKWKYRDNVMGQSIAAAVAGPNRTIYIVCGTYGSHLIALLDNGTNYAVKWQTEYIYSTGSSLALSSDGTIYWILQNTRIDINENIIYAITDNGASYTTKWNYTINNYIVGPSIIGADGIIYFGSNDNNVYALNSDGTLKWKYKTSNQVQGGFAIGSNGTLYARNIDGTLYAFKDVIAEFSTNNTQGNAPLTVQFTDKSTGNPTGWLWDFGDGTTSTEQNPAHTYTNEGNYTVKLTVAGNLSSDEKTIINYIKVGKIAAEFSTNNTQGNAPLTVQFTDKSTGNPTGWLWDFGDGTTSTEQNPTHIYSTPGIYTVKLTVTSAEGTNEEIKTNYITANLPTVANFTANQTTGSAPFAVQFNDTSPGNIFNWAWDFGDGTTSTEQNPTHIYSTPGNYTVKLTVTGLRNGTDEKIKTNYITVTPQIVTSNLAGGTYNTTQTMTLTTINPDNTIYYTNDTTDPRTSSTRIQYTEPIVISTTTTLRYAAVDTSSSWSPVYLQNYVIGTETITNSTGQSNYTGPQTNTTNWIYNLTEGVEGSPAIGADGTIYIGTINGPDHTGYFYAFNPNGTLKWKYDTDAGILGTPVIGTDGTIYVGTYWGVLYAFNPNGTVKWAFDTYFSDTGENRTNVWARTIYSSPAIGADGTIYIATNNGGSLYALKPDGSLKWKYKVGNIRDSPTIGSDGTIYVGEGVGQDFYAINPDGTLKWTYHLKTTHGHTSSSPAIGSNGVIYFGDTDGHFYALNSDGTLKWYLANSGGNPSIGADGTIFVNGGGGICALNPDNGTEKWKYAIDGNIHGCTIGADGTIYFGRVSSLQVYGTDQPGYSDLFALNPDGTLKWKYHIGGTAGSPTIGPDGTLYVGSWATAKFYAIKDDTTKPKVTANPASGTYYTPLNVTLTANETSEIYYTLDGTDPTKNSAKYTGSINISTSKTLKFTAWDNAGNQSQIYTEKYSIYTLTPYSYKVTVKYKLSNKKYRVKYKVAYKVKKKIRYKVGNKLKYKWTYVTKYKWKYKWDYRYGYRKETRWSKHWTLT